MAGLSLHRGVSHSFIQGIGARWLKLCHRLAKSPKTTRSYVHDVLLSNELDLALHVARTRLVSFAPQTSWRLTRRHRVRPRWWLEVAVGSGDDVSG